MGLRPPSELIANTNPSGHISGQYSVALTAICSETGEESCLGTPSESMIVKDHKVRIASATVDSRADRVGVYITYRGMDKVGPFFHLSDIPLSLLPATLYVPDDTELGELAPCEHNVEKKENTNQ